MHWVWCHPERHDDVTAWTLVKSLNIPIEFYFMGLMTNRARFFTVSLDDKERCPRWGSMSSETKLEPGGHGTRLCHHLCPISGDAKLRTATMTHPKYGITSFQSVLQSALKARVGPIQIFDALCFPFKTTEPAHCFFHLAYFICVAFHFPSLMWHSCKYSYSFFW